MNRHEVEASVDKITQKDGWMSQYNIGITDLNSLIGNFDCGYSTVWKLSHFPATNFI